MNELTNEMIARAAGYEARSITNADGVVCWGLFTPDGAQMMDFRMGGLVTNEAATWSHLAPDFLRNTDAALSLVDQDFFVLESMGRFDGSITWRASYWRDRPNAGVSKSPAEAICQAFMAWKQAHP